MPDRLKLSAGSQTHGLYDRIIKAYSDHVYHVDHVLFFVRDLREPSRFRNYKISNGTMHSVTTREEAAQLAAAFPERAKFFFEYIEQGRTAFYFERDQKVAAYIWTTSQDFYDRYLWKYNFRVRKDEFFHYAGYAVPEVRGTSVPLIVWQYMTEYYRQRGFTRAKTTISSKNRPSVLFTTKLGYKQQPESIDVYKLFNFRWSRETTASSQDAPTA